MSGADPFYHYLEITENKSFGEPSSWTVDCPCGRYTDDRVYRDCPPDEAELRLMLIEHRLDVIAEDMMR